MLFVYPAVPINTTDLATETKQDLIIAELSLDILDFMDVPVLDASSSNIPASASTPLTVVASLSADIKAVKINDTIGLYTGIYSDPSGTPVLEAIIGPGDDQTIKLELASGTEIGLRHMANSTITIGELSLQFLG